MAKIVVFGLGPMRWESSTRLFALALRSWHFARTLARAGHEVLLFSIRGLAYEGWPADKVTHARRGGVSVWSISEHLCYERPEWIWRRIRDFAPDAVVGVNRDPASVAVNFAVELPFWADINGDPLAEAQVKASTLGGDWNINEWFRKFAPVLHRADRFSTCSRAQRTALIGQLGMIGRMTAKNDGYEFISAIPNSLDDDELDGLSLIERRPRSSGAPFVLLWSGGYNTWTDPQALFEALELAMRAAPEIRFISTGGGIAGHHVEAYESFQQRVSSSHFRDRFELAGWVQTAELPAYYAAAHAAILVDRFSYEGVLGARTRMLDWLAAGLPIVSTRLSEISEELSDAGIARTASCGDVGAIADAIIALCDDPRDAYERGMRGRAYAHAHMRAELQLAPLLEWARSPTRAPDGEHYVELSWKPTTRLMLRQHTSLVRTELHEHGVRETVTRAGRFAMRRIRNGAARATERLGIGDAYVTPIEAAAPDAPVIEPPRFAGFQWRERFSSLEKTPRITFLVLVGDSPPHVLKWTCDQIRTQYVGGWSALLVQSDCVTPELEAELDLQLQLLGTVGRAVERVDTRNADLSKHRLLLESDWAMLLASGNLLRPDALAEFGWTALEQSADIVYANEQHVDETNVVMPLRPKPDWSPELFLARSYLGSAVLVESSRLELAPDRLNDWPNDAVIYDALLRATDTPCRVAHVSHVLSQIWTPQRAPERHVVLRAQRLAKAEREAVRDALWRRGFAAEVERGPRPGIVRIRWPVPEGKVALVVLGAAPEGVIERCRESLERNVGHAVADIVVARPRRSGAARLGSLIGDARHVVIVDPHLEAFHGDWLPALLEQTARPGVAAVSPRLVAPNGTTTWRPTELDGLDSWASEAVQEARELTPLCFAGPRRCISELEVPLDEAKRRAWLREQVARWARTGKRCLYTPFSFLYVHPHNGQHRLETVRTVAAATKTTSRRRLRQTTSR